MTRGSRRAWGVIALGFLTALPAAVVGQDLVGWMITIAFGGVGIALLWQRPREVVGWILVGIAAAFSVVSALVPGSASQVVDGQADTRITLYAWFNAWGASLFFGLFVALAALFPSGHFPAGRVGLAGRVAVVIPIVFGVALALGPSWPLMFADGSVAEVNLPIGIVPTWPGWTTLQEVVYIALLVALATSIATLIVRFRRSAGPERAQYKWLLAALATTLATVVFAFAVILLGDGDGTWMWTPAVIAYPMIPLSILVAIRRYRLYEIDRIVSRTIGWVVVSAMLAGVFAGTIIGLQALLAPFTNNNTLAVAGSTLLAAALFQPLRSRVQRTVDRRFNRARVDAQQAIDAFGAHLRDSLDLDDLNGRLLAAADATVQPNGAGLWIRGAGR
jgi:MFS family permease